MPSFSVDKRSIDFVVLNYNGSIKRIKRAAEVATALGGTKILAAIKANVGVPAIGGTTRTHRRALAALDSPYARRHGSIQIRPQGGSPGFGRRTLLVHTVSGDLLSAISGKMDNRTLTYTIKTDLTKAPHLRYVIRGTRVMLPRDILWATASDPAVRREVQRAVLFVFGRVFRTQASIRFNS